MAENINILNELKVLEATKLCTASKENLYFLPEDFFTNFPGNITRQIWLNSVPKITPFNLPAGYFENLPEVILDKVMLNINSSANLYDVPEGYFNNLAENILARVKAENRNVQQELDELAPLLSKLPKTNIYTVPSEYFETLALTTIPEKEQKPAKVISIGSKTRKWFTYAAAACVAALMFGGGYYYLNESKSSHNDSQATVKQYANMNVEQAISQLSDSTINTYLQNDNTDISIPQTDNQDIDIKSLIQNMSDEEINNYLLNNSDPGENTKGS